MNLSVLKAHTSDFLLVKWVHVLVQIPGKQMVVPDTLSRSPSMCSDTNRQTAEEVTAHVNFITE